MKSDEIKILINEFVDGELEKSREPILFTSLSQDEEAREYFKNISLLKHAMQEAKEEFPESLEERILNSAGSSIDRRSRWSFGNWNYSFLGYAAAIVLLFISFFFFNQSSTYQKELETVIHRVNDQQQMLQLLFNSLPAAEVNSQFENDIIIRAQL